MTFFYDLNKRLADLASKQDLHESKVTESEKWIQKAVNPAHKGGLHKALHVAQDEKIPKAKIEKATHSKNPKLRHMAQFAKNVANEEMADEGNAFTGKLASTPKGGKFKVGNKEFTDTSAIEEGFKEMDAWMASREKEKGTGKFDKKERTLPGGMKATTYTRKHEDDEEDDDKDAPEAKGGAPKKKGRPKSAAPKDQERVTKGSHKYKTVDGKRVKKEKTKEDLDSDSVMMTRPTNCSSESIEREGWRGGMLGEPSVVKTGKKDPNAKVEAWNGLMAIVARGQGMEPAVLKHLKQIARTLKPEELELDEEKVEAGKREFFDRLAPAAKKAAKVISAIAKHRTPVEEESTDKEDTRAERAGKKVAKDIEYDEGHKGKDDNKAEKAGKKVTKDIEYDDKKNKTKKVDEFFDQQVTVKGGDARTAGGDTSSGVSGVSSTGGSSGASNSNKNSATGGSANSNSSSKADANANANSTNEEKVEETTVAGSVAPAQNSAPNAGKGMQFGKGVYEGFNKQFTQALNESISIESKMEECGEGMEPGITITADGEEAAKLMMLLKLAGLENQIPKACPSCGGSPCGCSEVVDENSPDWPTDTETLAAQPELRTYSGGLNGPKSTGQTTVPVVASQLRRQISMEESIELERSLFKTWKNYKG